MDAGIRLPFVSGLVAVRRYHMRRRVPHQRQDLLISDALETLGQMFHDIPGWMVAGGISIGLHAGGFYRSHHDIDILIDRRSFESIINRAAGHGYQLHQEGWRSSLPPIFMVHYLRRLDLSVTGMCKLYLINPDFRKRNRFLSWLDLTIVYEGGLSEDAVDSPAAGSLSHKTVSGSSVRVAGLHYLRDIKQRRHKPADCRDLEVIRKLLRQRDLT